MVLKPIYRRLEININGNSIKNCPIYQLYSNSYGCPAAGGLIGLNVISYLDWVKHSVTDWGGSANCLENC